MRVLLEIGFEGTRYHGWQIQENAVTVQGVLEEALEKLLCQPVSLAGCSRTDAGVHATQFFCHFDWQNPFPVERLPLAINPCLPPDIAVFGARCVPDDFHARFSCLKKTYRYRVWNAHIRHPLEHSRAFFYPVRLDEKRMQNAAEAYLGEHDFASFMAAGATVKDTRRVIESFCVTRCGDLVEFCVTGNGFLYNMVRIMVGTLMAECVGKLDHSIPEIIKRCDRTLAGMTVPPQGLYLEKVEYPAFD